MAAENAAEHGGATIANPMHQFEIEKIVPMEIFGLDVSFTNSALFMVLAVVLVSTFLIVSMGGRALVPTRMQSIAELSYEFVANMVRSNTGNDGMRYFPFIFTLFIFILAVNMLGMFNIPGVWKAFTVTSHIIVTFALAATVFIGVTIIGFVRHGFGFLKLFVPEGVPFALLPLLVVIELISYFIRPISLSVRLFANMMAGHTLLKVFASFVILLGAFGVAPLAFMVIFTGLEIFVAFMQAFIFAVLTCIYLNEALHLHDH